MIQYLFKIAVISLPLILHLYCASINIFDYNNKNTATGITSNSMISKAEIDRDRTYEIYFYIDIEEECIKIDISSQFFDRIYKKNIFLKTYFIVERAIDSSKFKNKGVKGYFFSELGRNFNNDWKIKKGLVICSSQDNPLQKLNKGIYRIRFTVFKKTNFNYTIDIFSNNKIDFKKQISTN
ncbi:MAG: hypothetical protein SVR08_06785 [Spirochaetota bacterium]|nr:hypothetical protein [Spirochaetota bacterium]